MKTDLLEDTASLSAQHGVNFYRYQRRQHQVGATELVLLRQGQCGRERAGGAMDHRREMGVIVVKAVHQQTVHQRGIAERYRVLLTDDRRGTRATQQFQ